MLIPHLALFFDTSFISEAHLEDIKLMIDQQVEANYITDSVYCELRDGYLHNQCDERFSLIFDPLSENRLRNNFKTISLAKCIKEEVLIDFNQDNIFLKRSSLLCSGYYAWLHCCVNPSMITDPFRHYYNALLYMIHTKGDPDNKLSAFMGGLRMQEISFLERMGFKKEGFTASTLKIARRKRVKDIKKHTFKITDYELVLSAFLYFCYSRKNVVVLTCDNDLIDIKDNLIRSVIEKYTINEMLTKKLKPLNKYGSTKEGNIKISLNGKDVRHELKNTFKIIRDDKLSGSFQIAFYDRRDRKIYGGVTRIPVWLMDFVLEYRLNINCYSIDKRLEIKYPLNYIMNPTEDFEEIHFNITMRKERQYYGMMPDCEDICKYARKERDTPIDLTSFVEMSVFDSRNEPDFSNPWLNRGFALLQLGCYHEALIAFDKAIELQHDCAYAWYGKGISLCGLDHHEGAVEKFARAVEINPGMHEALYSWGSALWNLAALPESRDQEALLREAAEKYAKAVEINPDMNEAFYQWGNALGSLATLPETHDREALLRAAIEKFATALEIKPEMHEALFHWGHALRDLAALAEKPDLGALLWKAAKKYGKTVEIRPDMHEAIYQWGDVLGNLAALHEGPAREELLREAIEKFAMAAEIKPDMPEALSGWGYALVLLAEVQEGDNREVLLSEAVEKFAKAVGISPEMHEAFNGWGYALSVLADLHEGPKREALMKEAVEKCTKAIEIEPDDYEALCNLCNALRMLSYIYKGRQRTEILEAALDKAKRVEDLKPGEGIYNIACIYALLGQEKIALVFLKKATESDPQYRQIAAGDEDFRSLWEVKAFKNIVATY